MRDADQVCNGRLDDRPRTSPKYERLELIENDVQQQVKKENGNEGKNERTRRRLAYAFCARA